MSADTKAVGYTIRVGLDESRNYDCTMCSASSPDLDAARAHHAVHVAGPDLLDALQGLGAHPEHDFCFCLNQRQILNGHAGECREARAAIFKAAPPKPVAKET